MSLDISMEGFWDQNALNKEFTRQFYICHTCRLCFNLCPFFPALFEKVDGFEGDVKKISYESFQEMLDLCYQCKLCFLRCPYTPPHEFMIDIPRLALHTKAVKSRLRGVRLLDRIMGNTERLGKFGSLTAPIANWAHRRGIVRGFMQKAIGIHRDRKLPLYHRKTFIKWFRENEGAFRVSSNPRGRVALFYTCYVNYNFPSIGRAVVEVLRHNDVEIICPKQKCCGMPFLDGGLLENALKNAEFNVKSLTEAVDKGYDMVTLGPTCDYVLRTEYAHMLKDKAATEALARKSYYITEYLLLLCCINL